MAVSIVLLGTGLLVACSVLAPLPQVTPLEGRLQAFPTSGMPIDRPVTIHWDDYQIPFVVAETDSDAAFALGLVMHETILKATHDLTDPPHLTMAAWRPGWLDQ